MLRLIEFIFNFIQDGIVTTKSVSQEVETVLVPGALVLPLIFGGIAFAGRCTLNAHSVDRDCGKAANRKLFHVMNAGFTLFI